MIKMQDLRQTKTIELPSYPGSQVEVYDSLLIRDLSDFNLESTTLVQKIIQSLPKYIKAWNFVNPDESPMAITSENLGFLKQEDVEFLLNSISNFREEVKKKLKP